MSAFGEEEKFQKRWLILALVQPLEHIILCECATVTIVLLKRFLIG